MPKPAAAARRNLLKLWVDDATYEALELIQDSKGFPSLSEAGAAELKERVLGSTWMIRELIERRSPLPACTGPQKSAQK